MVEIRGCRKKKMQRSQFFPELHVSVMLFTHISVLLVLCHCMNLFVLMGQLCLKTKQKIALFSVRIHILLSLNEKF